MSFETNEVRRLRAHPNRWAICLPLILVAMPSPALAQAAQPENEHGGEILVTARKRAERLIDVPQTVQAISSEQIAEAGIENLEDLGRQTTNITLNTRSDNEPNVVIRGVGSFGNTQGIGFYIDEVQNFTDQSARLSDVERVEVLKGPQGTLYGGSNIGGAVKYIMRRPKMDRFSAEGSASYGSFETVELSGAVNIPASDTLAFRASAYFDDTNGHLRNTGTGNPLHFRKEYGGRLSMVWAPSPDFDAYLSYRYGNLDGSLNAQVAVDNVNDYRRSTALSFDTQGSRVTHGATLQLRSEVGGVELYSISSYAQARKQYVTDLDYSALDGLTFSADYTTRVYTQEIRAQSSTDGPLSWVVGGYFSHINGRLINNVDILIGADFGGPVFIPDAVKVNMPERTLAAFGDLSYDFGRFGVSIGARISRTKVHATFPILGKTEDSNHTNFIPKVSLSYDLSDDLKAFATYAKGFEPGRVNSGTGGESTAPYDPEVASNYEVGLKGSLADGRIQFELAAFYIETKDRQLETRRLIGDPPVAQEAIFNIGDSESYGFEAGVTLRPTREFTLNGGIGYLHAEWTNGEFELRPTNGFRIPYSPSFTASGSIDWTREIGDHVLSLRADASYKGALYWDVFNQGRADPYTLVGARIAFGSIDKGWEISLRGDNLFNEGYFTELGYAIRGTPDANGDCTGCHLGYPGVPRSVKGTVRFLY